MRPDLSPVAALVRRHDHDRFLTALFAPAAKREQLWALYAFNYEIARIREVVSEPILGRIRLEWWRESIAAIYSGAPLRRHEVVEPLAAAIRGHELNRAYFDRLIDTREFDLEDRQPASLAALETYAEASAASLVLLALEILGVRDAGTAEVARDLGVAYALAGLLRAMPFHASARRLYVPTDLAASVGLDIERGVFALKPSPALAQIVAMLAQTARRRLAAARDRRHEVPAAALPALLPGILAGSWLDRLARAGHNVFDPALAYPDNWRSWRLTVAAFRRRY